MVTILPMLTRASWKY